VEGSEEDATLAVPIKVREQWWVFSTSVRIERVKVDPAGTDRSGEPADQLALSLESARLYQEVSGAR
jgi:hypothetical protein